MAALDQSVCAPQIGCVDSSEVLSQRCADRADVHQLRDAVEDVMLALHVGVSNCERVNIISQCSEIDLRFNGIESKVRTQVQQPLMGLRT